MIRIFLVLSFVCLVHLNGENLDELISTALQNNNSLESINAKITAARYAAEQSDNPDNPQLIFTVNTLDSTEKMSQKILTLQQKIPSYGKLDAKKDLAHVQSETLEQQLFMAQVELVAMVKTKAYRIWELNALYELTQKYIALTQQNIQIYESYASISGAQHMGIMKAELSLSDLKIQLSKLHAQMKTEYAALSYLCAKRITQLDIDLKMGKKTELKDLQVYLRRNPKLLVEEKKVQQQNVALKLADLANYPDFMLSAGYAYRENYDNYFNVGVGLTLPIYGSEDLKEEEQRAKLVALQSEQTDIRLSVHSELEVYYAQMSSAYDIYHIVQDEALPKVEHMFELSNASVTTGADLFKYIDVLFTKLSLEKKSINAIAEYYKSEAKIAALTGEKQ